MGTPERQVQWGRALGPKCYLMTLLAPGMAGVGVLLI